jgi:flagellar basal body-associated protein FliL
MTKQLKVVCILLIVFLGVLALTLVALWAFRKWQSKKEKALTKVKLEESQAKYVIDDDNEE